MKAMINTKRKKMHPDITAIKECTIKWFLDQKIVNGVTKLRNIRSQRAKYNQFPRISQNLEIMIEKYR